MTEDQYARRALSELVACVASKWAGPIEGLQYRTLAYRIGRRGPNGEGVGLGMGRILIAAQGPHPPALHGLKRVGRDAGDVLIMVKVFDLGVHRDRDAEFSRQRNEAVDQIGRH